MNLNIVDSFGESINEILKYMSLEKSGMETTLSFFIYHKLQLINPVGKYFFLILL